MGEPRCTFKCPSNTTLIFSSLSQPACVSSSSTCPATSALALTLRAASWGSSTAKALSHISSVYHISHAVSQAISQQPAGLRRRAESSKMTASSLLLLPSSRFVSSRPAHFQTRFKRLTDFVARLHTPLPPSKVRSNHDDQPVLVPSACLDASYGGWSGRVEACD